MAGYIGSKAAVTQADGYTKTEADGRYVEGDDTLYVDQTNNRVGIGTSSPTSAIDVRGEGVVGNGTDGVKLTYSAGNSTGIIDTGFTSTGLEFRTGNSFAAKIDSSGNLLVGTSSTTPNPGVSLRPDGNVTCGNSAGGSGFEFANFRRNATQIGSITQSGTTSVSYNTSSDHRLKENVTDVTDGIARVKQLEPKRFNFIADPDKTVDGFLAHEAQAVVPEAVTGTHNEVDDDGNAVMQGIDQAKLVPLLTAALQEAITEIETLKTKVAALEAGE